MKSEAFWECNVWAALIYATDDIAKNSQQAAKDIRLALIGLVLKPYHNKTSKEHTEAYTKQVAKNLENFKARTFPWEIKMDDENEKICAEYFQTESESRYFEKCMIWAALIFATEMLARNSQQKSKDVRSALIRQVFKPCLDESPKETVEQWTESLTASLENFKANAFSTKWQLN